LSGQQNIMGILQDWMQVIVILRSWWIHHHKLIYNFRNPLISQIFLKFKRISFLSYPFYRTMDINDQNQVVKTEAANWDENEAEQFIQNQPPCIFWSGFIAHHTKTYGISLPVQNARHQYRTVKFCLICSNLEKLRNSFRCHLKH
jgi:hypothetical protein